MAELPPLAKTVQELAAGNIKEVPERYIRKDSTLETSFPVLEIPTIDLELLASSSTNGEELEKLRSALSFCGCIQTGILIHTLK
ncbi:codeine O-demethylase-like protein [Corchorus capsularis]|uniref:Codeine O-demethylase-like protein n=1 Tax=Corchorus capsularis TaxID=210143 RepID=A0A1R3HS18_COCAP|nr:codeine O-demethylase-like protein [Corchorus capsularis]